MNPPGGGGSTALWRPLSRQIMTARPDQTGKFQLRGLPAGEYYLAYFGFSRPRFRTFALPAGTAYAVDVIDTWNMTVEPVRGSFEGRFRIDLPGRQFMSVRLRRAE